MTVSRVLLVDDSPLNRLVLRRTLEAAGATVTEAADGLEAFELYRSAGGAQTFGLILMDLVMPCDGWTATAHIRALERAHAWRPAHIVACTSECIAPGSVALQRCWDVGMSGVLGKAVTREQADELLQRFCAAATPVPQSGEPTAPQPASPRSSMESEAAALPHRLRTVLCSKLYAGRRREQ